MTKPTQDFFASILAAFLIVISLSVEAGPAASALRESAEFIFKKFGSGVAGKSATELEVTIARLAEKYGESAAPLLRNAGHAGVGALEQAGTKGPLVIKLFGRRGDEALTVITNPARLSLFLKHGDVAADALIKHPGIADDLIGRFGDDAAKALTGLSRQSAQQLGIVERDGLLAASARSAELLPVIGKYGDQAMAFIWKHKGALAVTALLTTFLTNPEPYTSGVLGLTSLIAKSINWTLLIVGILVISFLPFITKSVIRAIREGRRARRS